ncbi:class I SAM-dependent methyltransferase [Chamaesiphon sp. VAR_48_metabat_135_sub]|uniref:class I SAM-dependent methyltransferase n=1 Tax=Chamaesiphon sp. VAR_48_metabat_135_sub TaxID=2964699 RepID=UPI00286B22AE|nr:class I SAM-dependent methyltransferase [Chamaesiphon sp. VAR_48_metabat_135_sub]
MKEKIKKIPVIGNLAKQIYSQIAGNSSTSAAFTDSGKYWEDRYAAGGNSGVGSYDKFAEFKAEILNEFVAKENIETVIEFGCGDGNQLTLAKYPNYLGLDISSTIISLCQERFATDSSKAFELMQKYDGKTSDLTLSLDVIYHLVEDEVFENYISSLFNAATRNVIIYSNNYEDEAGSGAPHVKNRKFTTWIEANQSDWKLKEHIPNKYPYQGDYTTGSFADFYIYEKAV